MATDREKLDNAARAMQMIINTRLTALQAAQAIMSTPNYSAIAYTNDPAKPDGDSVPSLVGGKVDHITLLAMAQDIEKYILGDLEEEAKAAMAEANKPKPTIVPAKTMP